MGFVARSVFWLGLVYSSMPFDHEPAAPAIQPDQWPGPLAACARGMSEDCRRAIERLRLAAEIAGASVKIGEALLQAPPKPSSADAHAPKDIATKVAASRAIAEPSRGALTRPVDGR